MDLSHITSQSLRRILNLTERKDQLVELVAEIETEISKALSGAVAPLAKSPAKKAVSARKAGRRASARKVRTGRTGKKPSPLKKRILALLNAAGPKGMRVKDIAAKLGLRGGNVSVWIGTTGKTHVSKVSPGVYAVKRSTPSSRGKAPKARRGKAAKPASKKGSRLRKKKGKN